MTAEMPYTPFMPRSHQSFGLTYLLDDHDDQLAKLYNQILRFLERDLKRIMDIAEKLSAKSTAVGGSGGLLNSSKTDNDEEALEQKGFQIMANVVWEEVGRAIMDEIGSIVFAAGQPNEFRKVGFHELLQNLL